jgi:membrane protease YdiL (CAAX protease family)
MLSEKGARRQAAVVMVIATLCLSLDGYHTPFQNQTWSGLLLYLALPLATILLLRQNPLEWGLGIGRWKWTLAFTLAGALGASLLLLVAVRIPALQQYYASLGPPAGTLWPWIGFFAIDMLVWEFFFRAFMLFGLEPALGELAIYVQMIPFVLLHFGKPEVETLSSIAGGILIGYVVRRCRSFWPAFFVHALIALTMYLL